MRRPEKAGVIRPRTLGLGRAAVPEPPPPPPPPPPSPFQNKRAIYGGAIVFVLFLFVYMFGGKNSSSAAVQPSANRPEDTGLRADSSPFDDGDDEGEGDEEAKAEPSKKKFADAGDDDEAEEDAGDDDEPEDKEDARGDDSEEEVEEKSAPVIKVERRNEGARSDANRDRSKTIESYFQNFGGKVVDIDKEGSYKYVVVRAEDMFGNRAILIRGCPHKEGTKCKHSDAFARARAELELRNFKATVLGGGRITRHPSRHQKGQKEGYISIFGYSKTFGACEDCNKIACRLIKEMLPTFGVKWANEGYYESDERKIRDEAWTRC